MWHRKVVIVGFPPSEFGKNISRTSGDLAVTEDIAAQLVRLPIWLGIDSAKVSQSVKDTLK